MNSGREKLDEHIALIKNLLLFNNVLVMMIGVCILAISMWLRFDASLAEWIADLEIQEFYIGLYILIIAGVIILIVSLIGCLSAFREDSLLLYVFVGTQVLTFLLGLSGSAVLLDNSTQQSKLQPLIRESMRRLIMNSHYQHGKAILSIVQENIGCCGADGPEDYLNLRQPLPTQCRDTVTGNIYFHGCVDELTWFFEEKTYWLSGLAMIVCFLHVINIVLGIVLSQAIKKEENVSYNYRH